MTIMDGNSLLTIVGRCLEQQPFMPHICNDDTTLYIQTRRLSIAKTDTAVSKNGSNLAMVAWNDKREILLIRTFKSEIPIPEVTEPEAILKASHVASSYGWNNVYIESDALTVIKSLAFKDTNHLRQKAKHIANNVFLLIPLFVNVSFVWTARMANRSAHLVGQWAKQHRFYGELNINSLPSSLVLVLLQESDIGVTT